MSLLGSRLRVATPSLWRYAATPATATTTRNFAAVGDQLPSVELQIGWPPVKHNLAEFAKDKSILVVGLPGAFTPC